MSDNTPTDAKPSRKPRKSAPRRRKSVARRPDADQVGAPASDAAASDVAAAAPSSAPAKKKQKSKPTKTPSDSRVATPSASASAPASTTANAQAPVQAPVPAPAAKPAPTLPDATPQRVLIRVPLDVRWRDLDAFNHVNNSKYLSYLEEARLQWMLTMPGQGLDDHVAPVVAAANLNYRRPIEWPNAVMVELFVERLGNTSVSIGHRIVARDDASVLYCDGNVVMVWIDRGTGTAAPLPEAVRAACR